MSADRPTVVIDKSVFQKICSEPDEGQRKNFWKEISSRYEIVIPFILIEEVWVNLAKPGTKNLAVVSEMAKTLSEMSSCWIDDDVEIVFRELIQRKRLKILPKPNPKTVELLQQLNPNNPVFLAFLDQRRQIKERIIRERIQFQNSILPVGNFLTVKAEKELFQEYVKPLFTNILSATQGGKGILEKLLGWQFRNRHPNFKRRIENSFLSYSQKSFRQYPATYYYLTTDMFYSYAPLCRLQKNSKAAPQKIIGRKLSEQRNNLEDQKYIMAARMCKRLLTRDEGMSNMMRTIKECGLWNGEVIFLNPRQDLNAQIPNLLI